MKKGLLVIMSGPSGVGKGTIRREVMKDKSLNLAYSISMTTRPKRDNEVEGVDYFFVDDKTFDENLKEDKLLEHATFVNHRYGTPKDYVEKLRKEGKNVLLEIEIEGAKQVLSKYSGNDVFSIFLIPPSFEELEKRIRNRRTEDEDVIQERLAKARKEMGLKYQYHYVVLNDDPERAANEIKEIIRSKMNAKLIK